MSEFSPDLTIYFECPECDAVDLEAEVSALAEQDGFSPALSIGVHSYSVAAVTCYDCGQVFQPEWFQSDWFAGLVVQKLNETPEYPDD